MSCVHTSMVEDAHRYTREDSPWILDEHVSVYGRLIHYLSGGGMKTFGRTVEQEMAKRKHQRFIAILVGLGVLWLTFYVF